MKRILILILVVLLALSLTSCGVKEKIEQKVGEKITEKVIEGVAGDKDTKVDIKDGTMTVKDKDGGQVTLGGTEWPDIDGIPEFKEGKIVAEMHDDKSAAMIVIEEVEKGDFEDYWTGIKGEFTENVFEMTSEDVLSFMGENSENFVVQLSYDIQRKTVTITTNFNK